MTETSLGGSKFRFGETLWTRVLAARDGARDALEDLIRIYWKPVYHFIRRRGKSVEDAKDLTQGFFVMMLARESLKSVDPTRGKFKTFLLTVLERFLANEHEHACAKKRGGGKTALPLNVAEAERDLKAGTPEEAFERAWAATVLSRAFDRLRRTPYFEVMELHLTHQLGVSAIAKRMGRKPKDVENALARGRKRFREAVIEETLQYVSTAEEAREELARILAGFREGFAGHP